MTTTALATNPVTVEEWGLLLSMAQSVADSHLFPSAGSPSAAAAIMLTARDLGIGMAAALQGLSMVQGRLTISPALHWGMITASGLLEDWKIDDLVDANGQASGCRVWMKRRGGKDFAVLYTVEDAKRAGLVKPGSNWFSYPENMCRWRAIGYCADVLFPDLLFGLKRSEELGAVITPDGQTIIDAEVTWAA